MSSEHTYLVNETFGPTLQGEGARAGTVNLWLRLAECNLRCSADDEAGFDCDTNFSGGRRLTAREITTELQGLRPGPAWVVLSGGEPSLQVDAELVQALHSSLYRVAIETNGTRPLPRILDWVTVSPKTAEHTLRVGRRVNELRYVRALGQAIPVPSLEADHYCISPAFEPDGTVKRETLDHCVALVMANPTWRLSVQMHKFWRVR